MVRDLGRGWRTRIGYLGSGVPRIPADREFEIYKKYAPMPNKWGWLEHTRRMGISLRDALQVWNKTNESVDWQGYYASYPIPIPTKTQLPPVSRDRKEPSKSSKVYTEALKLIRLYPKADAKSIVAKSLKNLQVRLDPGEYKLLVLAIHFAQNGTPPSIARIGGTPGGPFNSSGMQKYLRKKGAP